MNESLLAVSEKRKKVFCSSTGKKPFPASKSYRIQKCYVAFHSRLMHKSRVYGKIQQNETIIYDKVSPWTFSFPWIWSSWKLVTGEASHVSKNDFLMCECEVYLDIHYKLDERAERIRNANSFLMFSKNIMGEKKFSVRNDVNVKRISLIVLLSVKLFFST